MSYRSRPIKRTRRTAGEMEALRDAIFEVVELNAPMTVRQVFYQLVSVGLIDKSEREYKNVVVRLLGEMRRQRVIPYQWIADSTRWMRKPQTFDSLADALHTTARTYRRSLWNDTDAYVEVWLEKEALAGVLAEETEEWDVPLMVTRGYPSLSFLNTAAEIIGDLSKPTFLYYVGDHDPSGVDIQRSVEQGIRQIVPDARMVVERIAVDQSQVAEYDLLTRPTKRSDSRSASFKGESVEVDALRPSVLRRLVRESIERHVDKRALAVIRRTERLERVSLNEIALSMNGAAV